MWTPTFWYCYFFIYVKKIIAEWYNLFTVYREIFCTLCKIHDVESLVLSSELYKSSFSWIFQHVIATFLQFVYWIFILLAQEILKPGQAD